MRRPVPRSGEHTFDRIDGPQSGPIARMRAPRRLGNTAIGQPTCRELLQLVLQVHRLDKRIRTTAVDQQSIGPPSWQLPTYFLSGNVIGICRVVLITICCLSSDAWLLSVSNTRKNFSASIAVNLANECISAMKRVALRKFNHLRRMAANEFARQS